MSARIKRLGPFGLTEHGDTVMPGLILGITLDADRTCAVWHVAFPSSYPEQADRLGPAGSVRDQ